MKTLLLLSILALAACNKPKCWTCTETVTHTHEKTKTTTRELCNKTRTEIEKLENSGYSNTGFDKKHNDTITTSISWSCKVKR